MKSFDKLKAKLEEMFQLDQADLDFGIYRIMNARRAEITKFLDKDLLPQVRTAFLKYRSADKAALESELARTEASIVAAGMKPENSPKVADLRAKIAEAVDVTALENEVYDHLCSFFSRYYSEGDFISQRRYKDGVYAIPYEGEEVKLYWANYDQYYVKTTEHFRDYTFVSPNGLRFHFKIVEADTEKDNVKAVAGKERRFILAGAPRLSKNGDGHEELIVPFNYEPDALNRTQKDISAETARMLLGTPKDINGADIRAYALALAAPCALPSPDQKAPVKSLLEKHLDSYTKRNTFDYFIHKDLSGFLRRELDFYIKSEVMKLDDVEEETVPRVEQYLSKVKVIRSIAHKIIEFLAQIENFQKKLWLKKKFVLETNWCVTLDRVPESLYPEIAANEAQRQEWVRLFAIDELTAPTPTPGSLFQMKAVAGYTIPLTVEFLKANPFLVLDTAHFTPDFKHRLLASLDNLDDQTDGLLVHSENFQALNLLQGRYREQVQCVYIDPPYNTDASAIMYKNSYKNSSWISLIENRISIANRLMRNTGIIAFAIDDEQVGESRKILEAVFPKEIGVAVVRSNPQSRKTKGKLSPVHEYVLFYGKTTNSVPSALGASDRKTARYPYADEQGNYAWMNFIRTGSNDKRSDRPKLYYPIYVNETNKLRVPGMTWSDENQAYLISEEPKEGEVAVFPISETNGTVLEKNWHRGHVRFMAELDEYRVRRDSSGKISIDFKTRMDAGAMPTTWWDQNEYASANYGASELKELFGEKPFDFPKAKKLVQDCIRASDASTEVSNVIDFFAGSGTSGQAIIELTRSDEGKYHYVLVEMGDHFDTVLKPRIAKVVYSASWKDGKPAARHTGIHHCFKYMRLESYEDALANIRLQRPEEVGTLLDRESGLREQYLLRYMLDFEAGGSQSLLNLAQFEDPWNYRLMVGTGSVGETRAQTVDLVETFNWLLGLKVTRSFRRDSFHVVEGTNRAEEKVLVIWRRIRDLGEEDPAAIAKAREQSNRELETFFARQRYNTLDKEFDLVYVNGDNNLMNVSMAPDPETPPRYKVQLIEVAFHRLMFDDSDV